SFLLIPVGRGAANPCPTKSAPVTFREVPFAPPSPTGHRPAGTLGATARSGRAAQESTRHRVLREYQAERFADPESSRTRAPKTRGTGRRQPCAALLAKDRMQARFVRMARRGSHFSNL